MRIALAALLLVVACAPSPLWGRAADRLGVRGKRLHLAGYDRMDDRDVYVFCRDEHTGGLFGERRYDGACITLVCPAGDDGRNCQE